jgi:hypothetical protein
VSADLLRRAAARIREVAEAATPGPWATQDGARWMVYGDRWSGDGGYVCATSTLPTTVNERALADASHIALWHPAVALVVADWLENEAAWCEDLGADRDTRLVGPASTLARLILGEPA